MSFCQMPEAPIPSRQQRRTEQTRSRLIDAAHQLFLERGYDAVSIGEITERADLGAGTYYLHFRDKRGVYEALVRNELVALRTVWAEQRAVRKLRGQPAAEVSLMVELVLEALLADVTRAKLVLLDGPPLEKWLLDEIGREMAQVLADRVPAAELVANLVIGATLNAGRWALVHPRAVSTKRLVAETVAFCAAGVASTSGARKRRRN
jgi:AcrR family transcriptional regulator